MNEALETIEQHIAEGNEPVVAKLPISTPTSVPPTPTPEPPTSTPTRTPSVDFADANSIIRGMKDALLNHDTGFFNKIPFGENFRYTDYIEGAQPASKEKFLDDLELRINSNAKCDFYTLNESEIKIWTQGWSPAWEITEFCYGDCWSVDPPRKSNIAAFLFEKNDKQWTLRVLWLNDKELLIHDDSDIMPCD